MVGKPTNDVRGPKGHSLGVAAVILLVGVVLGAPVFADEQSDADHPQESASELAKKTQNPVADLSLIHI